MNAPMSPGKFGAPSFGAVGHYSHSGSDTKEGMMLKEVGTDGSAPSLRSSMVALLARSQRFPEGISIA